MENVNRELLRSVILNDLKEINQALFNGADIDTQDADGKTALILACENNNIEIIEFLLDSGANINVQDIDGNTALILASKNNNTEIVGLLLEYEPNPYIQNQRGSTAMMSASTRGNIEIVELLLNYKKQLLSIFPSLIRRFGVNTRNKHDMTSLMTASNLGKAKMVKFLLDQGADPNLQDKRGMTALMYASIACTRGNVEVVELLLKHNADAFIENRRGKTAFDIVSDFCPQIKHILKTQNRRFVTANLSLDKPLYLPGPDNKSRTSLVQKSILLPPEIRREITSYLFQDLKSLNLSQLRRVYQKVYGKKCPVKTKKAILKILQRK